MFGLVFETHPDKQDRFGTNSECTIHGGPSGARNLTRIGEFG